MIHSLKNQATEDIFNGNPTKKNGENLSFSIMETGVQKT